MVVTITWQGIITAAGVIAAAVALYKYAAKIVRWFDRQDEQDKDLQKVRHNHDEDIRLLKEAYMQEIQKLRDEVKQEHDSVLAELKLLCHGVRACLSGLQEQGCNGPVTSALEQLDNHLNIRAHGNMEG